MDRLEKALQKARQERDEGLQPAPEPAALPDMADGVEAPRSRRVEIQEDRLADNRIMARQSLSPYADVFRILRTKVHQSATQDNLRSVGVTSPNFGDGKTTVAINLALSLALDVTQFVCLVDLDLRRPCVHQYLGIGTEVGLGDYLLDDTPLPSCLVRSQFDRFLVLPTSRALQDSSETLATPKMAALSREMKSRYSDRILIYDLPPVLPQADVLAFLPNLDAVILVVREGVTPAEDLRRCLQLLDQTRLLGTVVNQSNSFRGKRVNASNSVASRSYAGGGAR